MAGPEMLELVLPLVLTDVKLSVCPAKSSTIALPERVLVSSSSEKAVTSSNRCTLAGDCKLPTSA